VNNNTTSDTATCLLCGSDRLKRLQKSLPAGNGSSFDILECVNCRLGRVDPILPPETLSGYYPDDYYSYQEMSDQQETNVGIYERISRYIRTQTYQDHYLPAEKNNRPLLDKVCMKAASLLGGFRFGFALPPQNGGRILDVGCGDGFFLRSVKNIGWEVHGIEMSAAAVNRAKSMGVEQMTCGTFDDASYPENYFDVIRFWSVLEHIHDPVATLAKVRRLLKPGGLLVLQVPNYRSAAARWAGPRWTAWDVPRHLYHFSSRSLKTLLEKSGFKTTRLGTCSVGTLPCSISRQPGLILRITGVLLDKILDWGRLGDCLVVFATHSDIDPSANSN
jgi:2-polyprenyl-3-methyl-5-hydroxy-6-metoxy-1,4-benzoquinol methylase